MNSSKIPFTRKGGRFGEDNFLQLLIGSQAMVEGKPFTCGGGDNIA